MNKLLLPFLLLGFCGLAASPATNAQTTGSVFNYGVWQTFGDPIDIQKYPEVKGRLCNFDWKDLEVASNVWVWDSFDTDLAERVKDSLPLIFMVYTEEGAPEWLYQQGVPKVTQRDVDKISYTPYYANKKYKNYFKRMITTVRQHIDSMPYPVRKWIIGVQSCFGSSGDYIGYKGTVDPQYELTGEQFYGLFTEFSLYYYNEYLNTNPKIYLLSNPQNNGEEQMNWLIANCPNSWIKCGSLGKGFQLNDEVYKSSWLYPLLNTPQNGDYIRARSELQFNPEEQGWWKQYKYRNMFTLMTYCVFWGLDWSNQSLNQIVDPQYDLSFAFYDKYAGQKNPALATNAMCALRDGLDASDTTRFPVSTFGKADRNDTVRYRNIANRFSKLGAKLEDPLTATQAEINNLAATGINDVGWDVFTGNYERYLHQLKANETSLGFWNIDAPTEPNSIHGKFARGISTLTNKDALYFDVDSLFFNKTALNAAYPVIIDISYLDSGTGGFSLFYDAQTATDKQSIIVPLTNSGVWKKASITLYDAYFGNRASHASDFYVKAGNNQTVLFSLVELSRPDPVNPKVGLFTPEPLLFDTTCIKSTGVIKSFILSGSFLNGSKIMINRLAGYSFSSMADSAFADSLIITNYGTSISKQVFVKFNPQKNGIYAGNVSISGGGFKGADLSLRGIGINSRPTISASIANISCNNAKDGAIDLTLTGGTGPFTYSWLNDTSSFKAFTQDINGLIPANYTVTINSYAGCVFATTYAITQPVVLSASVIQDSGIVCKGGTTTVTVGAAGGTMPYTGTGVFTVASENVSFIVTDAKGCTTETERLSILPGILVAPSKPVVITANDAIGVCNGGIFKYIVDTVVTATSYAWIIPAGSGIIKRTPAGNGISLSMPPTSVETQIAVAAVNACGSSTPISRTITAIPANPVGIIGPVSVLPGQTNLIYKVVNPLAGLTYTWGSTIGSKITAGQDSWKVTITWGILDGGVNVKANNSCGTSGSATIDVKINPVVPAVSITSDMLTKNDSINSNITIIPNPARDYAQLVFRTAKTSACNIELTDINGKIVWKKKFVLFAGQNREKINVQQFAEGLYFITIIYEDGSRKTVKMIRGR
jgi:PKD-like domain/SprB repeat/Secretion system C-terminal sorting domain